MHTLAKGAIVYQSAAFQLHWIPQQEIANPGTQGAD